MTMTFPQVLSFFDSTSFGVAPQESKSSSPPLSEIEFRSYLNKVGEVVKPKDLRLVVYQRGADPALRKVLWKHLLGIYPQGNCASSCRIYIGLQRIQFLARSDRKGTCRIH